MIYSESMPAAAQVLGLKRGDIVTLSGGGGKTSIMFTLGAELARYGFRVLVVTTTHIGVPKPGEADCLLMAGERELPALLDTFFSKGAGLVVAGTGMEESFRLCAVSPEFVCRIAGCGTVDFILIEADGAAMKPFKAPRSYEPVIPACTTLALTVAGLDALGLELDARHVHRPERIAALTGLREGERIGSDVMADVLCHPEGGRRNVPAGARWHPVINKVDSEKHAPAALELAGRLLEKGAGQVFLSSTLDGQLRIDLVV
ncbi:MAG: putative selenium-dependent hydroxylase accessory protein YqeC [Clostridiales Family XIII bacterium]|jgi:probable selenium-dependent hydroxylase accessory protein YqeC|nr:putative selenium-dependent hydroxylase accessory protein YqeC [Clostridiales Family XIII bacterium]